MDLQLAGKRALVIAASKGLGYATARGLAQEGCDVVINARNPETLDEAAQNLAQETGRNVTPLAGDAADHAFAEQIMASTQESLGGLDLLVTNAGGPPAGGFESFDDATWDHAIELSFLSHMRLIRAALPLLRHSEAASVLTITSVSVKQPISNLILSNSIRAATIGLTKSLALELGHEGIRFNSILPGWTETERVYQLLDHRAQTNKTSVEEEMARQMANCPLGRMATPEEFANVAVFLLSPAAGYVTGVMLSVDGGLYKGTF